MVNVGIIGAGRTFADLITRHTNQPLMGITARRRTHAPTYINGGERLTNSIENGPGKQHN